MHDREPLEGKDLKYRHEAEYRGHGVVAIYSYGPCRDHTALVREAKKVMHREFGRGASAVSSGGISGWPEDEHRTEPDYNNRTVETQTIFTPERTPHDYGCQVCTGVTTLEISKADLFEWKAGMHIQNALPYLSAAERELVKTGICGPCFDKVTGPED